MSLVHRQLSQLGGVVCRSSRGCYSLYPARVNLSQAFCSSPPEAVPDPIETHKRRLRLWFSHLPPEEKQFGGYFTPETMHVEPLILERHPEEKRAPLREPHNNQHQSQAPIPAIPSVTLEQLFELAWDGSGERGRNVLLYGAVGTGKSTVVRKLVLDWCAGSTLTQFKLLVPFSCEDLSRLNKPTSLRDLVSRKYLHLKKNPLLSGEGDQAKDVVFIFNGMEKMKLDFRISSTELCSDPNEPQTSGALVVNLLRKYLLPEASVLVTTRLSALDSIPKKYVSCYAQVCGFNDPERQWSYFARRLLPQGPETARARESQALIQLLYLNLRRQSQLSLACYLPSYCWLTCATLHFLQFTDTRAPIRTLTGIYTSFLRLNFGGEVLGVKAVGEEGGEGEGGTTSQDQLDSLMLYVVRTVGKLAYDGVTSRRTSFSEEELEQWVGGKTKTDEELRRLAMFRTDVLSFFLVPRVGGERAAAATAPRRAAAEEEELEGRRYVFAVPAMQEYLAALYVVMGENKTALEKLTRQVSLAIGQAGEDLTSLVAVLSKFIPLRVFAIFNLLHLFPRLYERLASHAKGRIAHTMAAELFRSEDSYNEDVLDQVEQSLLGVHGPQPQEQLENQAFELYPIFMGGLLHYENRVLLQQLGCGIKSATVSQITRALRKYLVREMGKTQPPEELMDLLVLLYEFQNPRLTTEVLLSINTIRLSNVRMSPLKCFILSSVLSCTPAKYQLDELDLSSCHITSDLLEMLWPAFRRAHSLNLQFNFLGPEACVQLKDLLLDPNCSVKSLQLCDNQLLESGASFLLEALPGNRSLTRLSLMHTGLGDQGARGLAERLHLHPGLQELNVAYNNIGDDAAIALVDACREHPGIHTVHLYLNPLSDVGKQSLFVRGVPSDQGGTGAVTGTGRRVKVLASVTEGSSVSEDWHPILNVIRKNALLWERERVQQQLQVFLRDLEWGRQQQVSFWKRLHFRKVEKGVRQTLQMLERDISGRKAG